MIYAGARYYMPNIGRWTSVDPLAGEFPAWSPYNYTLNNPLRFVDPDGRAPSSCCDLGGALRQTFGWSRSGFDRVADRAGQEQVQTQAPQVYKGWDAVRVLAKNVGIGATAVAIFATGGSLAVVGGAATALTSTAATAASVATVAGGVETVAALVDHAQGGPTTAGDVVSAMVSSTAVGAAGSKLTSSTILRTADEILVPTGLSRTLDASIEGTRSVLRDFGRGAGGGIGGALGAVMSGPIREQVNDQCISTPNVCN
jgi:uncharacterized protein RhaS with RHS repeats